MNLKYFILCLLLAGCNDSSQSKVSDQMCRGTEHNNAVHNVKRSLSSTPWGYTKVTQPVRLGQLSQRFELRPGDCHSDPGWSDCALDRSRTEVTVNPVIMPGQRRWIAYSIYLPQDWQDSHQVKTHLGQVHQHRGPSGVMRGMPSKPPLLQFSEERGVYSMCWHQLSGPATNIVDRCAHYQLATTAEMRGRWTDVVIDLNTHLTQGGLKVYVNSQIRVDITEPVVRYDAANFFFKYGIYRSFISRSTEPLNTQVVHFDEVRIGTSLAAVNNACNLTAVD